MPADRREIRVTPKLHIRADELSFSFSRSGGPGGQNVNKLNTRVTLAFDALGSRSLSAAQKQRLQETIPRRLGSYGVIRVSSQRHRTQAANRRVVVDRLVELLQEALRPPTPRKKTHRPHSADMRRLEEKRRRSGRKAERGWRADER